MSLNIFTHLFYIYVCFVYMSVDHVHAVPVYGGPKMMLYLKWELQMIVSYIVGAGN